MHDWFVAPGAALTTVYIAMPVLESVIWTVPEEIELPVLVVVAVNAAKTPPPATTRRAPRTSEVSRSFLERVISPLIGLSPRRLEPCQRTCHPLALRRWPSGRTP